MPALRGLSVLSWLPALAALLVAATGRAEAPAKPFGEGGQVAFDDLVAFDLGGGRFGRALVLPAMGGSGISAVGYSGILGYSRDSSTRDLGKPTAYAGTSDTVWFAPSLDVFVGRHFSVGGTIAASHARGSQMRGTVAGPSQNMEGSGYSFTLAPRVGYVIPLSTSLALWPRLTIGYVFGHTRYESNMEEGEFDWSSRSFRGIAELGLVARVHPNVYLRAAPELLIGTYTASGHSVFGSSFTEGRDFFLRLGATAGIGILLGG